MRFIATANTDVGIVKKTNEDSLLIKHATAGKKEVLMTIVCDGMGGLAKGELASASVIKSFSNWFDNELAFELESLDMQVIAGKWSLKLKDLNIKIAKYSAKIGVEGIGTTFTGALFIDSKFLIVHVGDSRAYEITSNLKILTSDQTFVRREIERGTMTLEQSKTDKRRNLLLQCVGASKHVEPQIIYGEVKSGIYMLCSDGFRHEITHNEIFKALNPINLTSDKIMRKNAKSLIDQIKLRNERDNISVILIKVK